jgi:Protein of unknown function (DUF1553)/Protein of unknown function (DUF1549)/Planctomycete cytochrome C
MVNRRSWMAVGGWMCPVALGALFVACGESLRANPGESARQLFEKKCIGCHGAAAMSGLDLRSRETVLRGGKRGAAIVPGDPDQSVLYQAVARTGDLKMPPGKEALSSEETGAIRDWIKAGAPWSAGMTAAAPSWWSFQKPKRPPVPAIPVAAINDARVNNPIDAFILAKLDELGLRPAPPATRATLIRRAYFDLTGLPPSPEEVKQFTLDPDPDAYPKLVERLLASPRYGEEWGKHWLDLVRYADTGGFQTDVYFKNAWRYRDYVIQSFNEDKPYDQFVQEQIAGDEIWPDNLDLTGTYDLAPEKSKHLQARIATGLYTFGPEVHESNMDARKLSYEKLTDWTDTTGSVFLGLTFACARCHDHKFDPITQRDYYRLQAIFAYSKETDVPVVPGMSMRDYSQHYPKLLAVVEARSAYRLFERKVRDRLIAPVKSRFPADVVKAYETPEAERSPEQKTLAAELSAAVKAIKIDKEMTTEEQAERRQRLDAIAQRVLELPELDAQKIPFDGLFDIPTATVLAHRQPELIPEVRLLARGELGLAKEAVRAGLPSFLGDDTGIEAVGPHGVPYARKALALWLTQPDHPLTARVMVNRIWAWHFGRGIVSTPSDFGRQGQPPSHPELLDWLATEFVSRRWSIKVMHRLILLSNTYRMSGMYSDAAALRKDPDNKYLWRMDRKRLEAESLWDAIRAVAGTLNLKMGGRAVAPPLSDDEASALAAKWQWPVSADPSEQNRRGVYVMIRRNFPFPMFEVFDSPDSSVSCPRREVTNVPSQALWLLNNRAAFEEARAFARRLIAADGDDREKWTRDAWQYALGRLPSQQEQREAADLMNELARKHPETLASEALAKLCLAIFNLNEFAYVD